MQWLKSGVQGLVAQVRPRLRALFRRSAVEHELDDELRFHIEMETEKNVRDGLGPKEARRRALLAFGGVERHKEEARDARGVRWLEDAVKDFRYAARRLRKRPGFSLVTVTTLALAIGANTAIFSVVDAVLLDPLPYPDADRLVSIRASAPVFDVDLPDEFGAPPEFYFQYRDATILEDLGMFDSFQSTMRTEDRIDRLPMAWATPSMFTTLGATPMLGRVPTLDDEPLQVAVISHRLWMSWFGGDPSVIGRSYEIRRDLRTVIGVMSPEFRFPDDRIDVWIHATFGDPNEFPLGNLGFGLVGRMAPGTEHEDLAAQLRVLARRIPERFGGSANYARFIEQHRPVVRSLEEEWVGDVAGPLWLLLATVGIVLLIACANIANLFIVRAKSRRRDLAVRHALGAGRAGLVRSQMSEALLLAALGGTGGALLAWIGVPLLIRAAPERIPNLDTAGLDPAALLFAAGISFLAACAFGLLPAIRFSRPGLAGGLRQAGRVGEASGRVSRNALVVVQTASALVLLVGAGLLVRSFLELTRVDPGYDTEDIFTFQIAPEFDNGPSYARFHKAFLERLAGLPGVESVGLTQWLPLNEGAAPDRFVTERTDATGEQPLRLHFTFMGGDFFETMGIELVSGRLFEPGDHATGTANAIVSRSAAELLWPDEDPLGQRVRFASDTTSWQTVVGIVEDILLFNFRQEAADPMIYLPMVGAAPDSWTIGSPAYVVKSTRAEALAPEIRGLVHQAAPASPMYRIFTMEALARHSMARLSFTMLMLAIAAGLALVLGAVGLYGVLSYVVSQRTREIAVRMALGAQAPALRRMVVLQGGGVTLVGVAVGLMVSLAVTRVLATLLFGVGALDATTFAAMAGVMVAVAMLASYVPARRASSVDPMSSLREE